MIVEDIKQAIKGHKDYSFQIPEKELLELLAYITKLERDVKRYKYKL